MYSVVYEEIRNHKINRRLDMGTSRAHQVPGLKIHPTDRVLQNFETANFAPSLGGVSNLCE